MSAVRPGLRRLLSRARRPLTGASFCSGQPSTPTSGRTTNLLSMATATNTSTAPKAIVARRIIVLPGPYMPATMSSAPSTATTPPMMGAKREKRDGGNMAPSCSAAMGGTRVARCAGMSAESSVTTTPTARAMMMVRGCRTRPLIGMSKPAALNTWFTPAATPRPTNRPTSEASTPMTSASPARLNNTCRRVAPRARSMANSRRRCATVIEKALKMMNAPTSTAMPPKLSSTGLRKAPIESLTDLVWSAAA